MNLGFMFIRSSLLNLPSLDCVGCFHCSTEEEEEGSINNWQRP